MACPALNCYYLFLAVCQCLPFWSFTVTLPALPNPCPIPISVKEKSALLLPYLIYPSVSTLLITLFIVISSFISRWGLAMQICLLINLTGKCPETHRNYKIHNVLYMSGLFVSHCVEYHTWVNDMTQVQKKKKKIKFIFCDQLVTWCKQHAKIRTENDIERPPAYLHVKVNKSLKISDNLTFLLHGKVSSGCEISCGLTPWKYILWCAFTMKIIIKMSTLTDIQCVRKICYSINF